MSSEKLGGFSGRRVSTDTGSARHGRTSGTGRVPARPGTEEAGGLAL